MFVAKPISYSDKAKFYRELAQELSGLVGGKWYMNLSNAAALLKFNLPDLNWVGFYLLDESKLYLGPFQGLPACLEIPVGRGVCGTAVAQRKSLLVDDVHEFPGHIGCDAASRSELVVPMIMGNRILGVLDLDSPSEFRFTREDQSCLETFVATLVSRTQWPERF